MRHKQRVDGVPTCVCWKEVGGNLDLSRFEWRRQQPYRRVANALARLTEDSADGRGRSCPSKNWPLSRLILALVLLSLGSRLLPLL